MNEEAIEPNQPPVYPTSRTGNSAARRGRETGSRIGLVIAIASLCIGVTGCVSHSARTYYSLDTSNPRFTSVECKYALKAVGFQEDIRVVRSAAMPALAFLTGGLALVPYAASHIALEAYDMKQAREIEDKCGGKTVTP